MPASSLCTFLLCFFITQASAQTVLQGRVVDEKSAGLPYVNIGIPTSGVGAVSDAGGAFSLSIPQGHEGDTLYFSVAGYDTLKVPVARLLEMGPFAMQRKSRVLETVTVSRGKLVEQAIGKGRNTFVRFADGSLVQRDVFEIGKLIKLDSADSKITSVNLFINEARADSGVFRINFYRYDGHAPAQRLLEQSIVQTKAIHEGWLQFDLSSYNLRMRGSFIVAIEFLPAASAPGPIYYGIVPGGSGSYVRKSSQGAWSIPPHRYRMFVTALMPAKSRKPRVDADEEDEAAPLFRMYSAAVQDSFSIFVRLPKGYAMSKRRRYPVAYLLDANYYFDALGHALHREDLETHLLVGIGYKDFLQTDYLRNRDYTYPKAAPEDSFAISGGGEKFLSFLQDELVPRIDSLYRTNTSSRALLGHSLGGYFTLYALHQAAATGKHRFHHYIAASPSLHYCRHALPRMYALPLSFRNSGAQTVMVTMGAAEDAEDSTGSSQRDVFDAVLRQINQSKGDSLSLHEIVYPHCGHMETASPSFLEGLHRIGDGRL